MTSLIGRANRDGMPVRVGEKLRSRSAIELDSGGTLRLAHTASARQWMVAGPARFVACDDGAEEIAIASGELSLESGTGVRPGAEVWLGTPFGSLRYSDARGVIQVTARSLQVRIASGPLWFTPLGESATERVLAAQGSPGSPPSRRLFPANPYRPSEERALSLCARDAEQAEQRARALLAPSAEPLGARAAAHVRARQQAHASCASAFASLLAAELPRSAPAPVATNVEPNASTPNGTPTSGTISGTPTLSSEPSGTPKPGRTPTSGIPNGTPTSGTISGTTSGTISGTPTLSSPPARGTPASGVSPSAANVSPRWAELARYDQMWRRVPDATRTPPR